MSHHPTSLFPTQPLDTGNSAGNSADVRTQSAQQNQPEPLRADRESVRVSAPAENARSAPRPSSPTAPSSQPAPSAPLGSEASGFSARQAAEYLGKDEKTVRTWLRTGRLRAGKEHGVWSIPRSALDAILVAEVRSADRESMRLKSDARPAPRTTKPQRNRSQSPSLEEQADREFARVSAPTGNARSAESALLDQLHAQISDRDRRLEDKDLRIVELKGGFERQLNEKDQRLNEKDQRIADIKEEREKDRKLYRDMLSSAHHIIQTLENQVDRLEAPRPHSRVSVLEVEPENAPEQGSGGPAAPGQAPGSTADDADGDEPTRPWWRPW